MSGYVTRRCLRYSCKDAPGRDRRVICLVCGLLRMCRSYSLTIINSNTLRSECQGLFYGDQDILRSRKGKGCGISVSERAVPSSAGLTHMQQLTNEPIRVGLGCAPVDAETSGLGMIGQLVR